MMMYTLGHQFMPPSLHAGGLRYHGMSPMVSHCKKLGLIDALAVPQIKVFQSAVQFARTEGIVPAPESAHAISVAIDEAMKCREEDRKRVIVFNLSGNGLLDLAAYDTYLSGKMHESGDD
jgi:tryptophan synthase beta chain